MRFSGSADYNSINGFWGTIFFETDNELWLVWAKASKIVSIPNTHIIWHAYRNRGKNNVIVRFILDASKNFFVTARFIDSAV